ncbi:MAG TPA: peptide-methionine (S)-S-oxide reductase MsrA [Pseudonocardiaceae bacterium]|nr:peptide-methionine (S)-S-oxide reductase MsrA [Pseudonocardiaceae bacterium]
MAWFSRRRRTVVGADEALTGRAAPLTVPTYHDVHRDRRIVPPFPAGMATAVFGMGCFWGAERLFWRTPGVWSTAVGYAGGHTQNPTYREVCSGRTGHTEAVLVVFDPAEISYPDLLRRFWEGHDPTQGMRQGNDIGTQYRSAVYLTDDTQYAAVEASRAAYQRSLTRARHGTITTEVASLKIFFYAEGYHQQYLQKNPNGYCGLGGTGVACPVDQTSGEV